MQITPINNRTINPDKSLKNKLSFQHAGEAFWKSDYSNSDKVIVAATTAKGVFASLMLLAKLRGKSIKPKEFYT